METALSMELALVEDNGSTTVGVLQLTGPVPRVGELIHVPNDLIAEMENYALAIVTEVKYRIKDGHLTPEVTAVASHGNPDGRHRVLGQLGWLDVEPGSAKS